MSPDYYLYLAFRPNPGSSPAAGNGIWSSTKWSRDAAGAPEW